MRLELRKRHLGSYRLAVAHDVEIRRSEVDEALAFGGRDERIRDVPFVGDDPVEDLSPAGNLVDLERDPCARARAA